MNEPVIVLDHLSKSFGNVHAVQNLSLQIETVTIFGFLGPNGAGKTTTMRMLCGLTHPTVGNATIAGADVWKDRHRVRTKFGYATWKKKSILLREVYLAACVNCWRSVVRSCTIHRSFFLMNRRQVLILF